LWETIPKTLRTAETENHQPKSRTLLQRSSTEVYGNPRLHHNMRGVHH